MQWLSGGVPCVTHDLRIRLPLSRLPAVALVKSARFLLSSNAARHKIPLGILPRRLHMSGLGAAKLMAGNPLAKLRLRAKQRRASRAQASDNNESSEQQQQRQQQQVVVPDHPRRASLMFDTFGGRRGSLVHTSSNDEGSAVSYTHDTVSDAVWLCALRMSVGSVLGSDGDVTRLHGLLKTRLQAFCDAAAAHGASNVQQHTVLEPFSMLKPWFEHVVADHERAARVVKNLGLSPALGHKVQQDAAELDTQHLATFPRAFGELWHSSGADGCVDDSETKGDEEPRQVATGNVALEEGHTSSYSHGPSLAARLKVSLSTVMRRLGTPSQLPDTRESSTTEAPQASPTPTGGTPTSRSCSPDRTILADGRRGLRSSSPTLRSMTPRGQDSSPGTPVSIGSWGRLPTLVAPGDRPLVAVSVDRGACSACATAIVPTLLTHPPSRYPTSLIFIGQGTLRHVTYALVVPAGAACNVSIAKRCPSPLCSTAGTTGHQRYCPASSSSGGC